MSEVVRGAVLPQAADRGRERRGGGLVVITRGEAGPDQVAFGLQYGRELPCW